MGLDLAGEFWKHDVDLYVATAEYEAAGGIGLAADDPRRTRLYEVDDAAGDFELDLRDRAGDLTEFSLLHLEGKLDRHPDWADQIGAAAALRVMTAADREI